MSSLLIEFEDLADELPDETAVSKITVTHLRTRTFELDDGPELPGPAPGVCLLHATRGSADLTIESSAVHLPPGLAIVVAAKQSVTARATPEAMATENVPLLQVIELNARIGEAFTLHDVLNLPLMLDSSLSDTADELFQQLSSGEASAQLPPTGADITRHLLAARLITSMLTAATASDGHTRSRNRRLEKLKEFLFQNLARPVTVSEMAHRLGMSRTTFCRWARDRLGCSPAKYFRQLRLERSQEWIAQDAGNLDEIANQTGFSHRYHLSREFKKHFGMTPTQYRKQARTIPEAEFLARAAEEDFRHGRFNEALAACEQCLRARPSATIRDRARYQKGLCLRALGRGPEAITQWRALEVSSLSHRAAVQECRQLFSTEDSSQALELLKTLYTHANETQKRDGVSLWLDQVLALKEARRAGQLRAYLEARGQLFPHDTRSMQVALYVLSALGDNRAILQQCRTLKTSCFFALRRTGELDKAIERFGKHLSAENIVSSMFHFGRYEEVLAMEPELPALRARALTKQGRAEEAIARYPDQSACAYLALGRYEELLERFPEHVSGDTSRTAALVALGRTDEVSQLLNDPLLEWQWFPAQLYIRPEALLESQHPEALVYAERARLLIALRSLLAGNRLEAEAMLEPIDGIRSPDFWWADHTSAEVLIVSLIRGLLGDSAGLQKDLDEVLENHKYKDKQALWNDAAYLKGKVSLPAYRCQPQRVDLAERATFIQAVNHELKGRTARTHRLYTRVIQTVQFDDHANLLRRRYAEWRLQQL